LWSLGVAVSMMTAFYMFRLLFLTFSGDFRGTSEQKHHLHESPLTMTIPLMVLALLATVGGFVGLPHVFHVPHYFNEFLDPVIYELSGNAAAHAHLSVSTEWTLMGIAVAGALFSIGLAFSMYVKGKQMPSDDQQYSGLGKVIYNKMYIDEIYDALFVKPVQKVSEILYKVVDQILIDGIVNLTAKVTMTSGNIIRSNQTGPSAFYILAMVLTLIFILGYFLISQ